MAEVGFVAESGESALRLSPQVDGMASGSVAEGRSVRGGSEVRDTRHAIKNGPFDLVVLLGRTAPAIAEARPDEKTTAGPATPWWLWWNILSVDAPMVAVAWAVVFGLAVGRRLTTAEGTVLFLTVWAIYVSDRLLDGWLTVNRGALRERHLFCERHRVALSGLLVLASGTIFLLATEYLPEGERDAGLRLGVILATYLGGIHIFQVIPQGQGIFQGQRTLRGVFRGSFAWLLPKEIAVGALFACGASLPVWSRGEFSWSRCVPWGLFALLCCLNCLAIERWENRGDGDAGLVSGAGRRTPISRLAAALAGAALVGWLAEGTSASGGYEWLAVGTGALLLLALHFCRRNFSPAALRVLADAALLIPAVAVLLLRGLAA
jgi:hypothetical protein